MNPLITTLSILSCASILVAAPPPSYTDASEDMRIFPLKLDNISPRTLEVWAGWMQNPSRSAGVATHPEILKMMQLLHETEHSIACGNWEFLPSKPMKFAPYLDSLFVIGNSCTEPSEIIKTTLFSSAAQQVKSRMSSIGLEYDLTLAVNYTGISTSTGGQKSSFTSFTGDLWAAWYLAKTRDDSFGVFMMVEANWGRGIGFSQRSYNAQDSTGALINPQSSYVGGNGPFISNLSLAMSAFDGEFVAMIGTMDPTNFLDQNAYAASWNGNLMNSAFGSSSTLPLLWANWAYMTAWQPHPNLYALYYTSGTQTHLNHNPFNYISSNYWAHIAELGYILDEDSSLGAGTYRVQYSITEHDGETGAGAAINIQQQLGHHSPLGFFSRAGYNDPDAARITGVKAAASAGFVLQAPFTSKGWGSQSNKEQIALGFYWARADESEKPYKHKDEFGLELTTVFQITPTFFIQPDIQYIFNPIHSPTGDDGACVLQIQSVWHF